MQGVDYGRNVREQDTFRLSMEIIHLQALETLLTQMVGGSNLFRIAPNGSHAMMLPLSKQNVSLNQQLRVNFTGNTTLFVRTRAL